jgi:adenylate kinase
MNLILLGAPGVGKGTQAKLIMDKYNIPQISTGDILRAEVTKDSDLGKEVQAILANGDLVPDATMLQIIKNRLNEPDCEVGFILDGFPRTIEQAEGLDGLLNELGAEHIIVINIYVQEDEIIKRLSSRRVCIQCGNPYNLLIKPPSNNGICDKCGGEVIQRKDDREETVKNRLIVYKEKTKPLIEYYSKKGYLQEVSGNQSVEDVFNDIEKILPN